MPLVAPTSKIGTTCNPHTRQFWLQDRAKLKRALKNCASVLVTWRINATGGIWREKTIINFTTRIKLLTHS